MEQEGNIVKKGQFYSIYRSDKSDLLLEDKTKRGLEVRERTKDEKLGVESEKGMIYDADGIGHSVGIRWYFPESKYRLEDIVKIAEDMEAKYRAMREMTCPEDQ